MGTWLLTSDYYDYQANHVVSLDSDPPEPTWLSVLQENGQRWLMKDSDYATWTILDVKHVVEKQGTKKEVLEWLSQKQFDRLWPLK